MLAIFQKRSMLDLDHVRAHGEGLIAGAKFQKRLAALRLFFTNMALQVRIAAPLQNMAHSLNMFSRSK
jgi:hypothetical protein